MNRVSHSQLCVVEHLLVRVFPFAKLNLCDVPVNRCVERTGEVRGNRLRWRVRHDSRVQELRDIGDVLLCGELLVAVNVRLVNQSLLFCFCRIGRVHERVVSKHVCELQHVSDTEVVTGLCAEHFGVDVLATYVGHHQVNNGVCDLLG